MCNYGTLLSEALNVACLAREERLRDEEWEVCVLVSCLLEHAVKDIVHLLPDGIAIGLDYHTTTYCRVLSKTRLEYQVVIPLRVVLVALGQILQFNCHILYIFFVYSFRTYIKKHNARQR